MDRSVKKHSCKIRVTGAELDELKRHGHCLPECPGLDHRIQKYSGRKPLRLSVDELGWLMAVLDVAYERIGTEP